MKRTGTDGRVEYRARMTDIPPDDRPRERLLKIGPRALSTVELLAILIRTGTEDETAMELACRLLKEGEKVLGPGRGLEYLTDASTEEICRIKGIGPAKTALIKAAVELGRRTSMSPAVRRPVLRCPADVGGLFVGEMRHLDREEFRTVLLNSKNQVIGVEVVAVGSLNEAVVHPREVFKPAIRKSAAAVILVHNHPSGDPAPSEEDAEVTTRLVRAGRILGIDVLDHVVIGEERYFSIRESGKGWPD